MSPGGEGEGRGTGGTGTGRQRIELRALGIILLDSGAAAWLCLVAREISPFQTEAYPASRIAAGVAPWIVWALGLALLAFVVSLARAPRHAWIAAACVALTAVSAGSVLLIWVTPILDTVGTSGVPPGFVAIPLVLAAAHGLAAVWLRSHPWRIRAGIGTLALERLPQVPDAPDPAPPRPRS